MTMPTTGPEEGHQNGEMSLENLFDDDDEAEMMLIDPPDTDHQPKATMTSTPNFHNNIC